MAQAEKSFFISGMKQALPVMLGYLTVSFAFGILAVQAGFTPVTAFLMSYLLYAGSAQFIGVSLVLAGVDALSVILTTFIVNLRHLLMSAALVPYLKDWSKLRQAWFAFEMTDETFAVHLARFLHHGVNPVEVFATNAFCHWSWVTGSVLGAVFGNLLGDGAVKPYGLDFALPGMFIALLLPHLRIPKKLAAVFLGAAASIGFSLAGAGQWSVVLATVTAATIAMHLPLQGSTSGIPQTVVAESDATPDLYGAIPDVPHVQGAPDAVGMLGIADMPDTSEVSEESPSLGRGASKEGV